MLRVFNDFYPKCGKLPKFERTLTPREEDDDLVQIDARLKELGKRFAPMPRRRAQASSEAFSERGDAPESPKEKREVIRLKRNEASRVYKARKAEKERHKRTKSKSKSKVRSHKNLSEDQPKMLPSTSGKKRAKTVARGIERVDEIDNPADETAHLRQFKLDELTPFPRKLSQEFEKENFTSASIDYERARTELIAQMTSHEMPGRVPCEYKARTDEN